mgnify:CR=1 FL=1
MREMRQLSLQSAFSDTPKKRERVKKLKVYDFFCGAGGYSEGCRRAGHKVVYACDVDPIALAVHKRNHPDTKHQCVQLPAKCGPSFLPRTRRAGRRVHLHGSPPCTALSIAWRRGGTPGAEKRALRLVKWYLKLAIRSHAASWSMEQVPEASVIDVLKGLRQKYPKRVAFCVVNFCKLGLPQSRKRLIAGTPDIVARVLRAELNGARQTVAQALPGWQWGFIWNTTCKGRQSGFVGESHRRPAVPISQPSPTIVAGRPNFWARTRTMYPDKTLLPFGVMECAVLQGFAKQYSFSQMPAQARKEIGNAVPPPIAEIMMGRTDYGVNT